MADRQQDLIDIGLDLLDTPKVGSFLTDKRYAAHTKDVKADDKSQVLNAIKQATGAGSTAENEAFDLAALMTGGNVLKPYQTRKLQGFLALRGDDEITLDGVANDKTKRAAKAFFESTADKRKKEPTNDAKNNNPFDLVKYKIPGNPYDGTDASGPEHIGFLDRLFGGEGREKERLKNIVAKPNDLAYQYVYTFKIPHDIKGNGADVKGLDEVPPKDRPAYVAAHRAEFEAANSGVTIPSSNDWHDYLSPKEKKIADLITKYESIQIDPKEVNDFQQNQIAAYREQVKEQRLAQYHEQYAKLEEKIHQDTPEKKELRDKIDNIDKEMEKVGTEQSSQIGGLTSPWIHGSMASPANVVDQHLRRQRGGDAILNELNAELHSIGQRDYGMIREVLTLQAKRRIWQAEQVVELDAKAKAEADNKAQPAATATGTAATAAAATYQTLTLNDGIKAIDKIGTKDAPDGATIGKTLEHMKLWSMTDEQLNQLSKSVDNALLRQQDGKHENGVTGKDIVKEEYKKQSHLAKEIWFSSDKDHKSGEDSYAALNKAKTVADIDKTLSNAPLWGMDSGSQDTIKTKATEAHRDIDPHLESGLYDEKIAKLRKEQSGEISQVMYEPNPSAPKAETPKAETAKTEAAQTTAPQAKADTATEKTVAAPAPESAKPVDPRIDQIEAKQQALANEMVLAIKNNVAQSLILSRIAAKNPELAKEIEHSIKEKVEPNMSPLRRMSSDDVAETLATLNSYPEGMGLKKIADPLAAFTELEQQRLSVVAEQEAASTPEAKGTFNTAATEQAPDGSKLTTIYNNKTTNQPENKPVPPTADAPQPEQKPTTAAQYNS